MVTPCNEVLHDRHSSKSSHKRLHGSNRYAHSDDAEDRETSSSDW